MKKGYVQGFAYACAQIIRLYDQPSMAINIMEESGIPLEDYKAAAEYDLKVLRKYVWDLPKGKV